MVSVKNCTRLIILSSQSTNSHSRTPSRIRPFIKSCNWDRTRSNLANWIKKFANFLCNIGLIKCISKYKLARFVPNLSVEQCKIFFIAAAVRRRSSLWSSLHRRRRSLIRIRRQRWLSGSWTGTMTATSPSRRCWTRLKSWPRGRWVMEVKERALLEWSLYQDRSGLCKKWQRRRRETVEGRIQRYDAQRKKMIKQILQLFHISKCYLQRSCIFLHFDNHHKQIFLNSNDLS